MQEQIAFYCKCDKKCLHVYYDITGDGDAPVLPNSPIKCIHDKRVIRLKNYTERMLLTRADKDGRVYI